jgi:bifunctional DNA-binding transcriptional regulator/antitoxin component of YhaV-PrlF toxin-antitoxin module
MSASTLHAEVTDEGTAVIPSYEVASLGARPGDRLRLRIIAEEREPTEGDRLSLRGALRLAHRVPAAAFERSSRLAAAEAESAAWPS